MRSATTALNLTLVLGLLLPMALPGAAAAPYLQDQVDPSRTGATSDPGPVTFDRAFRVELPGVPWVESVPVISGGAVYVQTAATPEGTRLNTTAIWRIDLATAQVEVLHEWGDAPSATSAFLSDGERVFLAIENRVEARWMANGTSAWPQAYAFPQVTASPVGFTNCLRGAVADGVLYLPCGQEGPSRTASNPFDPDETGFFQTEMVPVIVALDARTGAELWRWALDAETARSADEVPDVQRLARGLSITGDRVVVQTSERHATTTTAPPPDDPFKAPGQDRAHHPGAVWLLDRASGELLSHWRDPITDDELAGWGMDTYTRAASAPFERYGIVATPDAVFVQTTRLHAVDPETAETLWEAPIDEASEQQPGNRNIAYLDGTLYLTSEAALHAMDAATQTVLWTSPAPPNDPWQGHSNLLLAGGRIHGVTDGDRVLVIDAETGEPMEQRRVPPPVNPAFQNSIPPRLALGEEVLVILTGDGVVEVLGRVPASIQLAVPDVDPYPPVDAAVVLDLSDTRPGAQDPATEFQVNWGDGTVTPWTSDPVFEHAYARSGDSQATIRARNPAGQEATETLTFHVGQDAPVQPNFIETAFDRENQDMTFGVLGILIALTGGMVAIARRHRKRGILQGELAAIEETHARTRDDPAACQAALFERRGHCRGLLLEGRLDESQYAILDKRIDELAGQARLNALDDRFDFLPHGMVRRLQIMLEDGRVSALERDHFRDLLAQNGFLTAEQKGMVEALIDDWFVQDAGGEV